VEQAERLKGKVREPLNVRRSVSNKKKKTVRLKVMTCDVQGTQMNGPFNKFQGKQRAQRGQEVMRNNEQRLFKRCLQTATSNWQRMWKAKLQGGQWKGAQLSQRRSEVEQSKVLGLKGSSTETDEQRPQSL
jgi:hypothetical protein